LVLFEALLLLLLVMTVCGMARGLDDDEIKGGVSCSG
jgi:hypothetical protein